MPRPSLIASVVVAGVCAATALAGCGPSPNPAQVWLAPNGSERFVRLVPVEPNPF